MLHRFRERFGTAGLVVAIVALVAALGGTALAATGALTAKQKKEVKAIAKSFQGTGPAGAQGPAGANGTNGTNGKNGTNGESVTISAISAGGECGAVSGTKFTVGASTGKVCNGTNGTNGTNGNTVLNGTVAPAAGTGSNGDFYINTATSEIYGPKTAGAWGSGTSLKGATGEINTAGPLPVGKTEAGAWAIGPANVVPSSGFTFSRVRVGISYPIPLSGTGLIGTNVKINPVGFPTTKKTECEAKAEPEKATCLAALKVEEENCPGSVSEPKAKSGLLCIYSTKLEHVLSSLAPLPLVSKPSSSANASGSDSVGFLISLVADEEATSRPAGWGTWAVTG